MDHKNIIRRSQVEPRRYRVKEFKNSFVIQTQVEVSNGESSEIEWAQADRDGFVYQLKTFSDANLKRVYASLETAMKDVRQFKREEPIYHYPKTV